MKTNRRELLTGAAALGGTLAIASCIPPDQGPAGRMIARLRIIESLADGTLGVQFHDTATGHSIGLNADRRFGHCSSFKLTLAAKVLAEDARGLIDADRRVFWTQDELMFVSPFTQKRLDEGASLRELAEFTQKYSDNTAANVLLRELGGPASLTGFWRTIGDDVSRLDRTEPALNNVPVAEVRDTTTPAAMARTLARLLYGDALPAGARAALREWMIDTPTGSNRVRAGLPPAWPSGDKTGTSLWPGMGSLYVDIGFVEPEDHAPITFATYFRARKHHERIDPEAERALARVGEVLADFGEEPDAFPF